MLTLLLALIEITVIDKATGKPVPCRIHLKDPAGKPVPGGKLPFWRDHFVCPGTVTLDLEAGKYAYEVERGPEWSQAKGEFDAAAGAVKIELSRIVDLRARGWWSGDLHIHRALEEADLHTAAEDLSVAPVITWWNKKTLWAGKELPAEPLVRLEGDRLVRGIEGEDEREGGALLFFNLKKPIAIQDAKREAPSPMKYVLEARAQEGVHIDIEKPFWWDVPVWLASGKVDTIGIANNHMCRSLMYESEAWGKARDVARLPAPRGNGQWTQEIYYQVLESGLRVPPSAGSASGVLSNPVGYNRVYVQLEGGLDWNRWWEGLRAGRSFVTNGPLLLATAGGKLPGHVFKESGEVEVTAELLGREHVPKLEIVRDGRVVGTAPGRLSFKESGWFLVRAVTENPKTFRFASTAPWYVEIGGKPRISRASAKFFLDWVDEREKRVKLDDPEEKKAVLEHHAAARRFWQSRLDQATSE
jgi:hypothetical protein